MSTSAFRILFEVKILHDYFLAKSDASEFFALSDAERESRLSTLFTSGRYDVGRFLHIAPSDQTLKNIDNFRLVFVRSQTGFFCAAEVQLGTLSPVVSLNDNVQLVFYLYKVNSTFGNFTNIKMASSWPGAYYFTNNNTANNKTFPILALPLVPFKNGRVYEMGELAKVAGKTKQALERTESSSAAKWQELQGTGYVTEADRFLLPNRFDYRFEKEKNVATATALLKKTDGTEVKKLTASAAPRLNTFPLDLRNDQDNNPVEEGYYDLEITGDGGFSDSHRIYLQTMPLSANLFGMVVMDLAEPHAQFGLLDGGGALKNPYPVFEIRLKSRITYWRYRSSEGKTLSTTPKSAPFLTASAGQLVSVNPRSMTASPSEFQVDDPNTPNVNERIFLPNPNGVSLRQEADGRIYSDVFVPKIKDLINVS